MSDQRPCPICGAALVAWAEMDSDTGKSFSAKCPYCTTYVIPEGMIEKVQALVGDPKWLLSGTVKMKTKASGQPTVITDELLASLG